MSAYVGIFEVPDFGKVIPKITSAAAIAMAVSEVCESQGIAVVANAVIAITNVDVEAGGEISHVIIEYKRNAESTWLAVPSFATRWYGNDQSGTFIVPNIPFKAAGIAMDFRAHFLNTDGQKAIDVVSGKEIGVAAATGYGWIVPADTPVTFNGKTDVSEFPAVTNLVVDNGSAQSGTFGSPAKIPLNAIARLSWDDMMQKGTLAAHPMCDGTTATITDVQWSKVSGYKVWMYIADGSTPAAPTNQFPVDAGDAAVTGHWYLVGEPSGNGIEIDCPRNKKISFFVGAKLPLSEATGTRTTKVDYAQY
jgi:hypothetical protein